MKPTGIEEKIEAILFTADEPITDDELSDFFKREKKEIKATLSSIEKKYKNLNSGVLLKKVGDGWRFVIKPECIDDVKRFFGIKLEFKFSKALLETLAIIAYKQPVTIKEISLIRGTNSSYTVKQLLSAELIKISGRKPAPGRPLLFSTTKKFLEVFNISSLKELPTIEELGELFKENEN